MACVLRDVRVGGGKLVFPTGEVSCKRQISKSRFENKELG